VDGVVVMNSCKTVKSYTHLVSSIKDKTMP